MNCSQSASVKPQTITIPGNYVIRRKIDGVWKEQYVNITNKSGNLYEYDYGIVGYHEGYCKLEEIRELSPTEKQLEASGKTGGEVFGSKIWWNDLRPIHASLYILFALLALKKNKYSWVPLLVDVTFGLLVFINHHQKYIFG